MDSSPAFSGAGTAPPGGERADVPQQGTVRQGQALADCASGAVRRYLADMGSHPIDDLHRLVISEVERPLLIEVLSWTGGNQRRAAEVLGINRATLRKKLIHYGLASDSEA